jgi:hypothetical protein
MKLCKTVRCDASKKTDRFDAVEMSLSGPLMMADKIKLIEMIINQ